jgi:hypothetical protein
MKKLASKNRGVLIFMKCLDETPDVLGTMQQMTSQALGSKARKERPRQRKVSVGCSVRRLKEPVRSLSGHTYNMSDRFIARPSSSPGPCDYFTMRSPPKAIEGAKFLSRKEFSEDSSSTPGPYYLSEAKTSQFGFVPREPKAKMTLSNDKLGPGYYELSDSPSKLGVSFPKGSRDHVKTNKDSVPGPGHYSSNSYDSVISYSISSSGQPYSQPTSKLGSGYYETESVKQSQGHAFSTVDRFETPYQAKIESEC